MTPLLHADARLVNAASGTVLGGGALRERVDAAAQAYGRHPHGVIFALIRPQLDDIVRYLGAQNAGRPVLLLDPDLPVATLHTFLTRFGPVLVTGVPAADVPPVGYVVAEGDELGLVWARADAPPAVPHPDLGLLLTTSGSTGNPKLVRLSTAAVLANAESIARALGIDGDEVAPTSLPLHYTYGLSVLHSHLLRGASIVLDDAGLTSRAFWSAVTDHGVTSLAAVPYQYEILKRLRFDPARYPSLRTLTQAGGRLRPEMVTEFNDRMLAVDGRMFVMYGQTEATARMSVLPADRLAGKPGSCGQAVPGGRFAMRLDDGEETTAPGEVGEVIFRGPNVMMGYAETAEDLERGDDLGGVLATGDLGYLDDEGFLFLVGRTKRFAKVFGVRVNLDDVERMLTDRGPIAAIAGEDRLVFFAEGADDDLCAKIRSEVAAGLALHSSGVLVRSVEQLPLMPTGKVDYRALAELPGESS